MNHRNNRLFMSLPHDKLIDLLTYKAQLHGIMVICTEESYTSKSSFLHGDVLPVYQKISLKDNEKIALENEFNDNNSDITPQDKLDKNQEPVFSGIRDKQIYKFKKNKHVIFNGKKLKEIHADINGALNMPRKVFNSWRPAGLLSLNYEVIGQCSNNKKKSKNKSLKYGNYFKKISPNIFTTRCKADNPQDWNFGA